MEKNISLDFKKAREEINFLDYAFSVDYTIVNRESSENSKKLKGPGGDTIIYTKNKNLYYSVTHDKDAGDISNFITNRINGFIDPFPNLEDKKRARILIKKNMMVDLKKTYASKIKPQRVLVNKKELYTKENKAKLEAKLITDYSFFTDHRKVSIDTLNHQVFRGTIFNTYFLDTEKKSDQTGSFAKYTNYSFGIYNKGKIVGYEVRNKKYNSIHGSHQGLYVSNYKKDTPITKIFFAESGIDCLSHFELNPPKTNENVLYVSSSGNVYDSKINVLYDLLRTLNISPEGKLYAITDNDNQGHYYDHIIWSKLYNLKNKNNTTLILDRLMTKHVPNQKQETAYYRYTIDDKKIVLNYSKLFSEIDNFNTTNNSNVYGSKIVVKKDKDKNTTIIYLPKEITQKSKVMCELKSLFEMSSYCIANKPPKHIKDWNDQLKLSKEHLKKKVKTRIKL